jgi:exosortase
MPRATSDPTLPPAWLPFAGFVALWVPAMTAASYAWGHGEYYDYGWFVPPAALWLAWRRWREMEGPVSLPRRGVVLGLAAVLLPWFLVLRVLGYADPSWRLPIGLLGLTAALGGHWLIGTTRGWRASAGFVWITLLCLSAMPWPTVVENGIVRHLTEWVVATVAEVFQLMGKPVEIVGDRLRLHDMTVEVTDGCSGVRSFQSFVMATWFFAELQRLRVERTLVLLACACGVAFLVNLGRTYALAQIRFSQGEAAFHRAHDSIGLLAFLVSGLVFYLLSGRLSANPHRKLVRTLQSKTNP